MSTAELALDLIAGFSRAAPDPSRCLRARFGPADCRRCMAVCPRGALSPTAGGVAVDSARCSGCMLCAPACPGAAFEGEDRDARRLLAALSPHERPVLGCHRGPEGGAHLRGPCLGFFADSETLLAMAILFPDGVTLNLTACRDCENAAIVQSLRRCLGKLGDLPGSPCGGRIRLVEEEGALGRGPGGVTRREFFALFRKKSAGTARAAIDHFQKTAPIPAYRQKNIPPRRILLLQALPLLEETSRKTVEDHLLPAVTFGPGCRGCTGCVGVCPTGALSVAPGAAQPRLERRHCNGCRLCESFCPEKAISFG